VFGVVAVASRRWSGRVVVHRSTRALSSMRSGATALRIACTNAPLRFCAPPDTPFAARTPRSRRARRIEVHLVESRPGVTEIAADADDSSSASWLATTSRSRPNRARNLGGQAAVLGARAPARIPSTAALLLPAVECTNAHHPRRERAVVEARSTFVLITVAYESGVPVRASHQRDGPSRTPTSWTTARSQAKIRIPLDDLRRNVHRARSNGRSDCNRLFLIVADDICAESLINRQPAEMEP